MTADAVPKGAGKARLLSLNDLDGRTAAAKHVVAVRGAIVSDLGGDAAVSAMAREMIDSVAVLGAMLRHMGTAYLTGQAIDMALFATLANSQRRLLADLGLARRARDVTTPTDLDAYLAAEPKDPAPA